jgi:hypothetical protein
MPWREIQKSELENGYQGRARVTKVTIYDGHRVESTHWTWEIWDD